MALVCYSLTDTRICTICGNKSAAMPCEYCNFFTGKLDSDLSRRLAVKLKEYCVKMAEKQ